MVLSKATISVDGKVYKTVDLYSQAQTWQHRVVIDGLPSGNHVVTIQVLGTHQKASNGNIVVFDGFFVP